MNEKLVSGLVTAAAAALGILLIGLWVSGSPAQTLAQRLPLDHPGQAQAGQVGPTDLRGTFEKLDGAPAEAAGTWHQFRGPAGDNLRRRKPDWPSCIASNHRPRAAGPPVRRS